MKARVVLMAVTLATVLAMLTGGMFHSTRSALAAPHANALGTQVQVVGLHASSYVRNPFTGQVVTLPVYVHSEYVTSLGQSYVRQTVTAGVPTGLLKDPTHFIVPNIAYNSECDTSYSWCAALTMNSYHYTDHNDNCYQVVAPWETSVWTRNDRTVTLSNSSMNLGIASGFYCGGVYLNHNNYSIAPFDGANFTLTPSWGSRAADTSSVYNQTIGSYQCMSILSTLHRGGSSWPFEVRAGYGSNCQ